MNRPAASSKPIVIEYRGGQILYFNIQVFKHKT
jgi:hypothetical protein